MKIKSNKYNNVLSNEEDKFIGINIEKSESHLLDDQAYEIINSNTIYNYEKNLCNTYRIALTLELYASNVLFNITNTDSYESVTDARIYVSEDEAYTFTENEVLTEKNGWFGYLTGLSENEGCTKQFLRPYPTDLNLLSDNGFHNYHVFLTYEYDKDDTVTFNSVPLSDGISIYSSSTVNIDNRDMTKIVTPINHNLSENDEIIIYYTGETQHSVYAIGDENNEHESNMFIIDDLGILPNLPIASLKRKVNGILSDYYITKHKKLSETPLIYKNAFANTIYEDTIFSMNIKNDIDIADINDAFNFPLTNVFLTIVKKRHTEYENFFFSPLKSGFYTIYADSDYDITTLSDVLGLSLENNISLESMYGNLIEFNKIEQKVYYLEPVYHRFNSKNRSDNGYHEGYYYAPHYLINLKEFSEYIDESSNNTDAPSYAFQFNDNRYIYRNLNENSLSLWPYTNDAFYVYEKFKFFLKRQDPCFTYGSGNLNPIKGNCDDFSDKKFKTIENPC